MFWSAGCSLVWAEGFSCSLGVLCGGLGISKLQFFIQKLSIFGHQNPGSGLDRDWIQIRPHWIRIRNTERKKIENHVSAILWNHFFNKVSVRIPEWHVNSSQLVPSLVGPLLEVSLVPQREVRQTLLPLLFRLMETEQAHKGNFR